MIRAFLGVAAGLLLMVASLLVFMRPGAQPPPLPPSLPPTWTPTVQSGAVVQTPLAARLHPTPTPTPMHLPQPAITSSVLPGQAAPGTAPAAPVLAPDPSPAVPVAALEANGQRIDRMGPVSLPTVAGLAAGAGLNPVRLLIPALNLDAAVLPMGWRVVSDASGPRSEWEVVDDAAGHHIDSAFPGEPGNVVLSGHHNTGGSVFRSLCVIGEPGVDFGLEDAMILVDEAGRRFTYRVNGWERMPEANATIARRQENARYMAPTAHPQLTLITCWPPWSNTHRVVVTGLLAEIELP